MTNQEACTLLQGAIEDAQRIIVGALRKRLFETVANQCHQAQRLAYILRVTQELDPNTEFTAQL